MNCKIESIRKQGNDIAIIISYPGAKNTAEIHFDRYMPKELGLEAFSLGKEVIETELRGAPKEVKK